MINLVVDDVSKINTTYLRINWFYHHLNHLLPKKNANIGNPKEARY